MFFGVNFSVKFKNFGHIYSVILNRSCEHSSSIPVTLNIELKGQQLMTIFCFTFLLTYKQTGRVEKCWTSQINVTERSLIGYGMLDFVEDDFVGVKSH